MQILPEVCLRPRNNRLHFGMIQITIRIQHGLACLQHNKFWDYDPDYDN